MLCTCRKLFIVILTGISLNGCGGSDNGLAAQTKHAQRSTKQAASPYAAAVQELYVAYFGRPADPIGLANFENALAAAGAPTDIQSLTTAYSSNKAVQSLIDSFGTSKESQTLYGAGSTQDFVTAVFNNVLGRAPQASGLAYWSGAIDNGSLSKGDAALAIMAGALANTTVQGQVDTELIDNRLAVAASFTAQVAGSNATASYSGASAASSARGMLGQVGAYTDITQFSSVVTSAIDTIVANAPGIHLLAGSAQDVVDLASPAGMVKDTAGNLYVTDRLNHTVNKIAPDGTFTVIAGSSGKAGYADGTGAAALFNAPWGIGLDSQGNLYVVDSGNVVIRKITPAGMVSTLAGSPKTAGENDGTGTAASFFGPTGLVVDSHDNIFVADTDNSYVRKVTTAGVVTTVRGTGGPCDSIAAWGCFGGPMGLAFDHAGNLYITDVTYGTVRKMTPDGLVSIIAGTPRVFGVANGPAASATFEGPSAIAIDSAGNLFISDLAAEDSNTGFVTSDTTIRKIDTDGTVSTVTGAVNNSGYVDGYSPSARLGTIFGLLMDSSGTLYIADTGNAAIRTMDSMGAVSTIVGGYGIPGSADGTGQAAEFFHPTGIVADAAGNVYVSDTLNATIRKITPSGMVTTAYGGALDNIYAGQFSQPTALAIDVAGNLYVTDNYTGEILFLTNSTFLDKSLARLPGSDFLETDRWWSSVLYNKFGGPNGCAMDGAGNLYVTDSGTNEVRKIAPGGSVTVLAGSNNQSAGSTDGSGSAAAFKSPTGITIDAAGNTYVADSGNNTIRKITPAGLVTTLAGTAGVTGHGDGTGPAATFNGPTGVAIDGSGNLYVADSGNNLIRKITPSGVVTTVAGTYGIARIVEGSLPGGLYKPQYLAFGGTNTLYVTTANAVVRVNLP